MSKESFVMPDLYDLKTYLENLSSFARMDSQEYSLEENITMRRRTVFYLIHKELSKRENEEGTFVAPNIDIRSIQVDPFTQQVFLEDFNINRLTYAGSGTEEKATYLDYLNMIAITTYVSGSLSNGILAPSVVRDSYEDSVKEYLPEEDREYYENVLFNEKYEYYSDYIDRKNKVVAQNGNVVVLQKNTGSNPNVSVLPKNITQESAFAETLTLTIIFGGISAIAMFLGFMFFS